MNRRRFFTLVLLLLIVSLFISGCAGTRRINDFFQQGEYKQHNKLIDFMIFFTLFFAMAYLGFSKWFGEGFGKPGGAKGAVVGLSIALSLMLTFALVTQTKFSITTLFPLAKAVLFLVFCLLMYGLLNQIIEANTPTSKVVVFLLAAILVYILMTIFTHFVCQMSDNMDDPACRSDFFNAFSKLGYRHIWGPGTLLGGTSGSYSAGSQFYRDTGSSASGTERPGEAPGERTEAPRRETGREEAEEERKTDRTPEEKEDESSWYTSGWLWIPLILILLFLLSSVWIRKKIVPWHIARKTREVKDLIKQAVQLRKNIANILHKLTGPNYSQQQCDADFDALKDMMDDIKVNPHVFQRQKPPKKPIKDFFDETDATGQNFAHFPPLLGNRRPEVIDMLHDLKILEWKIAKLLHLYRKILTNRDREIQNLAKSLKDKFQSPKMYPDRTVELMFDSSRINDFNSNVLPRVRFFGNIPPNLNLTPGNRNTFQMQHLRGSIYRLTLGSMPHGFRTEYVFEYKDNQNPNQWQQVLDTHLMKNQANTRSVLEVDWT